MVQEQAGSSPEEGCFWALLEGFCNRPVTSKVAGKAGGPPGGRVLKSLTMFRTFWDIPETARKKEAGLQRQAALDGNQVILAKSLPFSKVQFSPR